MPSTRSNGLPKLLNPLVIMLTAITAVFILVIARDILVPLVLGVFLALLLFPAAEQFERWGWPRIITNLFLIILFFAALSGVIFLVVKLFFNFSEDLPFIKSQINQKIRTFQLWVEEMIGMPPAQQNELFSARSGMIMDTFGGIFKDLFTATTGTIFKIGILPVFTFMFLYYRDKFRRFLFKMLPQPTHSRADNIIREICYVTPSYLKGLLIVVSILAVVNSLAFYFIGVRHPLFFGIVAALFNLIPYLGTILGYLVALIFVLGTQSMDVALALLITFFIIQFVENNILTPNITGVNVSINPFVTILMIVVGGMIWGLPGMFIVIPMMSMLKVTCENIPDLRPIAFLIGVEGTERHALTFEKIRRTYQKLFKRRI